MSAVLGIDVSSFNVDLVRLDETANTADWYRAELAGKTPLERCRAVREALPPAEWFDGVYLAAIERPRTPSFVSAAAQFPVFGAVVALLPERLEVWDVLPQHWKQGLGLKGNASKEEARWRAHQIAENLEMLVESKWPQDRIDAWAVAYHARELNARGISADAACEKQLVFE